MTQLLTVLLGLYFARAAFSASSSCQPPNNATQPSCSLNGACDNNGDCVCEPGWIGENCGQLDLRPAKMVNGYNRTGDGISSWCGGIVADPSDSQLFHLFASEISNNCTLGAWSPFSRIVRATSSTGPAGPYTYQADVVESFAHNPSVIYSERDKLYLLYNIGCPYNIPSTDCTASYFTCSSGDGGFGQSGITIYTSPDLIKWQLGEMYAIPGGGQNGSLWNDMRTNPGPLTPHDPDAGQQVVFYRGCPNGCSSGEIGELIGVASAEVTLGNYTVGAAPLFSQPAEDPFAWQDRHNNTHLLVHNMTGSNVQPYGDGGVRYTGSHAFAAGWNGTWNLDPDPGSPQAYTNVVLFEDGSNITYWRRERPSIYFSPDAQRTPLFLVSGVQEVGTDMSYTLIQPIGDAGMNYGVDV